MRQLLLACVFALSPLALAQGPTRPSEPEKQPQNQLPEPCVLRNADGSCAALDREKVETPQPPVISNIGAETRTSKTPAPVPTTRPQPPPTEFQRFVAQSTGELLSLYGHRLFLDAPAAFSPVERIPVTAEYVVGPDDEIVIRAWGQLDINYSARVDRNGAIYIPKVGNVQVAGLRYDQLQEAIRAALGRVFRNFDVAVTLGQLKAVQVFVVGNAFRPGSYTVSSMSSLLNAVFEAGGPSPQGSVRRIQLRRGERLVTELDLYDLLLKGDKSKDSRLLPGDVIHFPSVGPQVAVHGSVNAPAIYELRGPATVGELLAMAGGLTTTATTQRATLERIEDRVVRRVEEFNLDEENLRRPVRDGDLLRVLTVSPKFEGAVTLRGNVAWPGRYPWREGLRVRDLIPSLEALVTREYWQKLNNVTEMTPGAISRGATSGAPVTATGLPPGMDPAAAQPTDTRPRPPFSQDSLRNEVTRSAPDINWDYALIQRLDKSDLSTQLIPFNLGKAVLQGDAAENMLLAPGDVITIFSQADITVPVDVQSRFVRLQGEVVAAGVYRVGNGQTLRALLASSGGLTRNAYLFGTEFTRESTRREQQARYDEFIDSLEKEIERTTTSISSTVSNPESAAVLKEQIDSQRRLVQKLRGVKVKGQIILEIAPQAGSIDELPDIPLEDGDELTIPNRPLHVSVFGAVYNENSFIWDGSKRLSDYLREAGGPRKSADARDIFVIRANGSVISRNSSRGFFRPSIYDVRVMPGDTIVVPEQFARFGFIRGLKDFAQIISQFALGAAAIRVISRP